MSSRVQGFCARKPVSSVSLEQRPVICPRRAPGDLLCVAATVRAGVLLCRGPQRRSGEHSCDPPGGGDPGRDRAQSAQRSMGS